MKLFLIVSNDIIMKPPYEITQKIVSLTSSISLKLGEINAQLLVQQSPKLRKQLTKPKHPSKVVY